MSRLGKLVLALVLISTLLFVALAAHMMATGVGVPYQDATPEQASYERFHNGIAKSLMLGFAFSFLLTLITGTTWVIRRLRSSQALSAGLRPSF